MENVGSVMEEIEEEYLVLKGLSHHPNMPHFHGIFLKRDQMLDDQVWIVMEVSASWCFFDFLVVKKGSILVLESITIDL